MKPTRPPMLAAYGLAGVLAHVVVAGSVLVAPHSRFLPVLWFLAGAFLPLAAFVPVQRTAVAAFVAFAVGLTAAALAHRAWMHEPGLLPVFVTPAFLIPMLSGAAAFAIIGLASRNA